MAQSFRASATFPGTDSAVRARDAGSAFASASRVAAGSCAALSRPPKAAVTSSASFWVNPGIAFQSLFVTDARPSRIDRGACASFATAGSARATAPS